MRSELPVLLLLVVAVYSRQIVDRRSPIAQSLRPRRDLHSEESLRPPRPSGLRSRRDLESRELNKIFLNMKIEAPEMQDENPDDLPAKFEDVPKQPQLKAPEMQEEDPDDLGAESEDAPEEHQLKASEMQEAMFH